MRVLKWLQRVEDRVLAALLWLVAALVALHDVYYLFAGLDRTVLGEHAFRQSQTALTAYWVRFDGLRLAYETPVLGSPWTIPFEFPFYQWLVAGLFRLGLPLEAAGRLVSFAFLLACIWPFAILRRALKLPVYALPLITILFLAAPVYAFWGRAVLIETCALFFALLWLALVFEILAAPRLSFPAVGLAALAGCVAILQKSTTFPAFGLIGGLYLLVPLFAALRRRDLARTAALLGIGVAVCLLPLGIGVAWVHFTDQVKLQNPAGGWLTSQNLVGQNYGTWAQRHSPELWSALQRAAKDTFGLFFKLAIVTILACGVLLREKRLPIAVGILAFLFPFAVFANLHIVHNYYQAANAVFLVSALALALTGLFEAGQPIVALGLLVTILVGQLMFFADFFGPRVLADHTGDDEYRIALLARQMVPPDEGIILDNGDWSSVINLYSQRKGIALVPLLAPDLIDRVFADPSRFLGGMKAGAIITCPPYEPFDGGSVKRIEAHVAGRSVLGTAGACKLLSVGPG